MRALVFTLKEEPPERLDLSPLVPHLLRGKTEKQIAALAVGLGMKPLRVGDLFKIRFGDCDNIRFAAGSERLDWVGHSMQDGRLRIDGDVGICAGRLMQGGTLTINGSAGHWAASGLTGGHFEILGDCGDFLGGPRPGEMAGMRGGTVHVAGQAGERAGDRMRRGVISIDGKAGVYAGSRMIAGTLLVSGRAGALPGYLMKRGTLILARGCAILSPTFLDCGEAPEPILALMAQNLSGLGLEPRALRRRQYRRFGGDTAVMGKGELFVPA